MYTLADGVTDEFLILLIFMHSGGTSEDAFASFWLCDVDSEWEGCMISDVIVVGCVCYIFYKGEQRGWDEAVIQSATKVAFFFFEGSVGETSFVGVKVAEAINIFLIVDEGVYHFPGFGVWVRFISTTVFGVV